MKAIPLTKGAFAVVDDRDFAWLSQWKWHLTSTGRAARGVRAGKQTKTILMHRMINQTPDGFDTDHINGFPLDNRRCNLRTVTAQQNSQNRKKTNSKTSSQYKGVNYSKLHKKWRSSARVLGKRFDFGFFNSEIEAAAAYNKGVKSLFGEFARCNQVQEVQYAP